MFQSAVLSLLDNPSRDHVIVAEGIELLVAASSHLKQIAVCFSLLIRSLAYTSRSYLGHWLHAAIQVSAMP